MITGDHTVEYGYLSKIGIVQYNRRLSLIKVLHEKNTLWST